jgi:hypothetical protein
MDDERTAGGIAHLIADARADAVTIADAPEVVALAMLPRDALGEADLEWTLLDRAVLAMQARDWPAAIVPISAASLRAPSFAYRVRDLAERHHIDPRRIWLEVDSPATALAAPAVVHTLSVRHVVGCRIHGGHALDQRAAIPRLAEAGVTFAWLDAPDGRPMADHLPSLIGGRSLVRRARTHGMKVIGPPGLGCHLVPPARR